MNRIAIDSALVRRVRAGAVALFFVLSVSGCERPPGACCAPPANPHGARQPAAASPRAALPAPAAAPQPTAAAPSEVPEAGAAGDSAVADVVPPAAPSTHFTAYYFHRTLRCATCLSIEKQAQAAIELAYDDDLSAGTLEWRAVNIEEPGNGHFEQDFELQTQSLVLVETTGERVTRWKLLPKVWELVEDPDGFQQYVVREVALFIGGG